MSSFPLQCAALKNKQTPLHHNCNLEGTFCLRSRTLLLDRQEVEGPGAGWTPGWRWGKRSGRAVASSTMSSVPLMFPPTYASHLTVMHLSQASCSVFSNFLPLTNLPNTCAWQRCTCLKLTMVQLPILSYVLPHAPLQKDVIYFSLLCSVSFVWFSHSKKVSKRYQCTFGGGWVEMGEVILVQSWAGIRILAHIQQCTVWRQ